MSTGGGLPGNYRTWAGSLLHPHERFLPGLGARLGRYPRLAGAIFSAIRRLPTRRLRAGALRAAAQPLARRMDAELEVAAVGGVRMIADVSTPLGKGFATTGLWEWNVGATIQQILRPGDVFVDVGANVGYYTLLAARIVGFGAHVYALEPAPGDVPRASSQPRAQRARAECRRA